MNFKILKHLALLMICCCSVPSIASVKNGNCEPTLASTGTQSERENAIRDVQARFLRAHSKYNAMMPQVGMGIELGMALDFANDPYSLSLLADVVQENQLFDHVARAMNRLHSASNISHRASENNQPIAESYTPVLRNRMNSLIATSYLLLLRSAFMLLEKTWVYAPQDFYDVKESLLQQIRRPVSVTEDTTTLDWTVLKNAAQYVDRNSHRLGRGATESERPNFPAVISLLTSFMGGVSNDSTDLGRLLKDYRTALSKGDTSVRGRVPMPFLRLMILEFRKNLSTLGDAEMLIWIESLVGPVGVVALNEAYPELEINYGSAF